MEAKGLYYLGHIGSSMKLPDVLVPLSPSSHGGAKMGPWGITCTVGLHRRSRALSSRKEHVFSWVPSNFATLTLKGDAIFILLNSKQTCSLLHRVILSSRLSKRQIRTKLLVLLLATHAGMWEPNGKLSPKRKSKYTWSDLFEVTKPTRSAHLLEWSHTCDPDVHHFGHSSVRSVASLDSI